MSAPDSCRRHDDVAVYALGALPDEEAVLFASHLDACPGCRVELTSLQGVVDQLPLAAPVAGPPARLKDAIMAVVESEARLLRAAGPEADRVTSAPSPTRLRRWLGALSMRPPVAAALACTLLVLGVAGGLLAAGGSSPAPTRTLAAWADGPATAKLTVADGGRGTLHLASLANPPEGKVYEVWVQRGQRTIPTRTLFTVPSDGRADVAIDAPLRASDRVLITAEPKGGSAVPTSHTVVDTDTV